MSRDKEQYEALRWVDTASEDLDAAHTLLEKGKYSHMHVFLPSNAEKML